MHTTTLAHRQKDRTKMRNKWVAQAYADIRKGNLEDAVRSMRYAGDWGAVAPDQWARYYELEHRYRADRDHQAMQQPCVCSVTPSLSKRTAYPSPGVILTVYQLRCTNAGCPVHGFQVEAQSRDKAVAMWNQGIMAYREKLQREAA